MIGIGYVVSIEIEILCSIVTGNKNLKIIKWMLLKEFQRRFANAAFFREMLKCRLKLF